MDLDGKLIGTHQDLLSLFNAPYVAIDTESNGFDNRFHPDHKVTGISAWRPGWSEGKYFPYNHRYGNVDWDTIPVFKGLIEETDIPIVFHNAKHDKLALKYFGIDVKQKYYCTMLMAHFIREELQSKSLDAVSKAYGGSPKNRGDVMQKLIDRFGWGMVPVEMMAPYAANDAKITGELFPKLLPTFKKEGFDGELWEIEKEFSDLVTSMEILGIPIDRELSEREAYIGQIRLEEIVELLGANPASRNDMEEIFLKRLKLPPSGRMTSSGAHSFDKEAMKFYEMVLEQRHDETAQLVFEHRGWHKSVTANYRPYLSLSYRDILHPGYKLHGARTSRLSCERPNLQQIPRESPRRWNGKLKKAFISRDGYSNIEFDYSNLEMRIGACYGDDPRLLATFNNGRNLFTDMATDMGRDRDQVKTANYAIGYGCGARKLGLIFGMEIDEARAFLKQYRSTYAGLTQASTNASSVAKARGYVKLWTGRRRHFEDPQRDGHKAFNAIVQGGGAEIMKRKMLELSKILEPEEARLVLTVHDSIVVQIEKGKENKWVPIIKETMSNVGDLHPGFGKCPFPVDSKVFGT